MPVDQPLRPDLQTRLGALFRKHDLEPAADLIRPLARECISLRLGDPTPDAPVGASRIGGSPDVPADFVWPRERNGDPLPFIAQVNLADVPRVTDHPLPASGLLALFYAESEGVLVHVDGPLVRTPRPDGNAYEYYAELKPHLLAAELAISIPGYCSPLCPPLADYGSFHDLVAEAAGETRLSIGQLLGWPEQISGDLRETAHLRHTGRDLLRYKTHMTPEVLLAEADRYAADGNAEYAAYLRDEVQGPLTAYRANLEAEEAAAAEWTGLLVIRSNSTVGLCVGDFGFFTSVVRRADLAAARFDAVYCADEA